MGPLLRKYASEVGLERGRVWVEPMGYTERSFKGCQECAHKVKIEEGNVAWSSRQTRGWAESSHGIQYGRERGRGRAQRLEMEEEFRFVMGIWAGFVFGNACV